MILLESQAYLISFFKSGLLHNVLKLSIIQRPNMAHSVQQTLQIIKPDTQPIVMFFESRAYLISFFESGLPRRAPKTNIVHPTQTTKRSNPTHHDVLRVAGVLDQLLPVWAAAQGSGAANHP